MKEATPSAARTPSRAAGRYVYRQTASPQEAAQWSRRRIIVTNLRTMIGRAYPRVIGLKREPSWMFFEILLPFLTTSAFVFVYRALQAPQEFIGFVVLGGAMTAFWGNVIWTMGVQLYWEKDQGNLDLYFTTPISMMSVLFGMASGSLVSSCLRAAIVLLVGALVYGVSFAINDWLLLGGVFALTLTALYGFGMILASLFVLWGREAYHLTQALQEPAYFVSGLNFPVAKLGALGAVAISVIPLAVGLDAMRQLAFTGSAATAGVLSPGAEALVLVAMTVIFIGVARVALRKMEWLARHEGRLTLRGG
ncbi:MAG: type transport system permease protein [Chloroflexota bacterium]|jgi:ABC-2 type transport system permease protein|nr:type transport system permease protein [Chloroflexota bacterium]